MQHPVKADETVLVPFPQKWFVFFLQFLRFSRIIKVTVKTMCADIDMGTQPAVSQSSPSCSLIFRNGPSHIVKRDL